MFGRKRLNKKNVERNRKLNIERTNRKERRRNRRKESLVSELVDISLREMNDMADVADVTGQFRNLLMSQLERVQAMEKSRQDAKNYSQMEKIVIGICPGDGIGPIIMEQAVRLLREVLSEELGSGRVEIREIEGLTIENRLEKNQSVPDDVMAAIKECDVLLKGPTETPKGGNMESANVTLRRELDLFANVRPISVPEKGIDWVFFRENTEGEYVLGSQGVEIPGKLAFDFKVTTDAGTRRIARKAFEYARDNGKTSLACVTKANIMKKTDGNFSRICHELSVNYPGVKLEDWYVDIMAANLINPDVQKDLQVILTPNLYGDILSDEAAQIQGGVGTAGSANIGDSHAMFEAIHGTAPRMIEDGLGDYANPASIFSAAIMMLRHIGFTAKATFLEDIMTECLETEKKVVVTGFADGATCKEFADYVMEKL